AQGYALLNERLAPDIAVLEGGYSIEKALPYVNVGIILAMAGLDYSHVREPDYDPAALRQSAAITRAIEEETDRVLYLWKSRGALKEKLFGCARYVKRKKFIHYDTDGISEQQEETVRICGDCGGLVMIESAADTGNRIFAVILPGRCCPECRDNGEMFFERINRGKYNYIYFQDRERGVFLVK
ncbi:MAG: histone deacetylase, partial [Syntrophales bacterium]